MEADKRFPCEICGKAFKLKSDMIRHTRIHTGEKPYKCDVCEKTFSQPSPLVNHKRIHTGEKPYECIICKKTFIKKSALTYHKRVHTGEKKYECAICKKTFSYSSNLSDHKKVHTGEKPFSCDVCQKSYSQSSTLSQHNKTAAHLERMKNKNIIIPHTQSSFVDCGESIKEEDIKKEIKEEENVGHPSYTSYSTETCIKEEIKEDVTDLDEGQGIEDSNLDTDNIVDCSEYVQVQMNLAE